LLYFCIHAKLWNSIDGVLASSNLCMEVGYKNDMVQAIVFTLTIMVLGMVYNLPF